jgi:hypothetical protein
LSMTSAVDFFDFFLFQIKSITNCKSNRIIFLHKFTILSLARFIFAIFRLFKPKYLDEISSKRRLSFSLLEIIRLKISEKNEVLKLFQRRRKKNLLHWKSILHMKSINKRKKNYPRNSIIKITQTKISSLIFFFARSHEVTWKIALWRKFWSSQILNQTTVCPPLV